MCFCSYCRYKRTTFIFSQLCFLVRSYGRRSHHFWSAAFGCLLFTTHDCNLFIRASARTPKRPCVQNVKLYLIISALSHNAEKFRLPSSFKKKEKKRSVGYGEFSQDMAFYQLTAAAAYKHQSAGLSGYSTAMHVTFLCPNNPSRPHQGLRPSVTKCLVTAETNHWRGRDEAYRENSE